MFGLCTDAPDAAWQRPPLVMKVCIGRQCPGNRRRVDLMGLLDKVKDLLSKNADKVDTAIDKAGDVVDRKYKGTVDKVEEEAKKFGIGE
jgi:MT0933-like antitoxin protein